MDEKEREITKKYRLLTARMESFTADDLNVESVKYYEDEMYDTSQVLDDLEENIEELLLHHSSGAGNRKSDQWRSYFLNVEKDFKLYLNGMNTRAAEVIEDVAIAEVNTKCDTLKDDALELLFTVREVINWDGERLSDQEVSRAMLKINDWKEDLNKIVAVYREWKEIAEEHDLVLDEEEVEYADDLLDLLTVEVKQTVQEIEKQDDVRKLYSLDTFKAKSTKVPTFGGGV